MPKHEIAIFLESKIPCFSFKQRHLERMKCELPYAIPAWCRNRTDFLSALPHARTALTWTFEQEWFDIAPELCKIGTPAAGRDFFHVTSVPPHIEIRNGTFHGSVIAETALGMLLAVNRGILKAFRHQLNGELWPAEYLFDSRLIYDSHAVIIGFGHIGSHIGHRLKSFGVHITGIKRNADVIPPDWFGKDDSIRPPEDLHPVLSKADHVIAVLPSDTATDGVLGRQEFEIMPSHAVVYNFGRGNCIDEKALAYALRNGVIAGACLDVFAREPLSADSPLADKNLPGLLRMPHSSAFCDSYIDCFLDEFTEWIKN
ncbi:MAG: NAD(P)-dependent oxidoreductase [Kiritimatiellia bacterium]